MDSNVNEKQILVSQYPKYNYEYKGIFSEKLNAVIFSLEEYNLTIKSVRTVSKES